MTGSFAYRSTGAISQGDSEEPDSPGMDISSAGSGYSMQVVSSRSLTGTGNTTAPGHVRAVHEEARAGGVFVMDERRWWISFTSPL